MSGWPWLEQFLRDVFPFFAIGILIGSLVSLLVSLIIAIAGA